jgi:hypothetical protein
MARSKGIYKRKDSPYWWIEYTGPDGQRRQESTKTTLKTEADYLLAKSRKEAMEGVIPTKSKKAVNRHLKLTHHRRPKLTHPEVVSFCFSS